MDPVTLTVLFKGIGLILALLLGFGIAYLGFLLYRDGAGLGRDKVAFEVGSVKVKAYSVGSVVMATAFMWAWLGVFISPNLEKTGNDYKITSFVAEGLEASIPSFSMLVSADSYRNILGNRDNVAAVFAAGFEQNSISDRILMNGTVPEYIPGSVRSYPDDRMIRITTRLVGDDKKALVLFQQDYANGLLTFTPTEVKLAER